MLCVPYASIVLLNIQGLRDLIDPEHLPVELGGTMKDFEWQAVVDRYVSQASNEPPVPPS